MNWKKSDIQCKCGAWFMNRKALGAHIKAQKKRVDISALHSAKREAHNAENAEGAEEEAISNAA